MNDKQFPCVVSFYTLGTLYQMEVQNLIASCEEFGIEHDIVGVASQGSWELNCAYKPFFILEKLKELGRPILWVDADGVFVRRPEVLEEFQADLATRIEPQLPQDHPSKVISATIYVNNTAAARSLLRAWQQECIRQCADPLRAGEFWDQVALRDVLFKAGKEKIYSLPVAYTKIFDHPVDQEAAPDAVITHYQASRRLKNHVNELGIAFKSSSS